MHGLFIHWIYSSSCYVWYLFLSASAFTSQHYGIECCILQPVRCCAGGQANCAGILSGYIQYILLRYRTCITQVVPSYHDMQLRNNVVMRRVMVQLPHVHIQGNDTRDWYIHTMYWQYTCVELVVIYLSLLTMPLTILPRLYYTWLVCELLLARATVCCATLLPCVLLQLSSQPWNTRSRVWPLKHCYAIQCISICARENFHMYLPARAVIDSLIGPCSL